ncbi:MAG: large repetitive protein [Blastocatellia bacterium]|nr:large repetitive protein [Blastocatellia bacterium]
MGFCLADGMPLVEVFSGTDKWNEGSRLLKEKDLALSKRNRAVKWRYVLMAAMTVLIATVVMSRSVTTARKPAAAVTVSGKVTDGTKPASDVTIVPDGEADHVQLYKIIGRVTEAGRPLSDVKIRLTGTKTASVTTGASGGYEFRGLPADGGYAVTAEKLKITFTPPSHAIDFLKRDEAADFVGLVTPDVYRITGRVTSADKPLSEVRVTLRGTRTGSMRTDARGYYAFTDLPGGGNYTISPASSGLNFSPRAFRKLTVNQTADFSALPQFYRISGRVGSERQPFGRIIVLLTGAKNDSTRTDKQGFYVFDHLPANGAYTITPSGPVPFTARSVRKLVKNESVDFLFVVPNGPIRR